MPSALLGCRQAWPSLSAGQRGRSGVPEPAVASSLTSPAGRSQPPKGLPLCQLPASQALWKGSCGGWGAGRGPYSWGQRGQGRKGRTRRQRLGPITGSQGQVT